MDKKPAFQSYFNEKLKAWADKFNPPLTLSQAAQIMLDESDFSDGEFIQPRIRELYIVDWEDYCHNIVYGENNDT